MPKSATVLNAPPNREKGGIRQRVPGVKGLFFISRRVCRNGVAMCGRIGCQTTVAGLRQQCRVGGPLGELACMSLRQPSRRSQCRSLLFLPVRLASYPTINYLYGLGLFGWPVDSEILVSTFSFDGIQMLQTVSQGEKHTR